MKISIDDWYDLRNIVLEAVHSKKMAPVPSIFEAHEVVKLVEAYLESGRDSYIDKAAKLTASYRNDLDKEVTTNQYWLLLEKS